MRDGFQQLNDDEYNKLRRTIPLITVLVAGADGEIHGAEKEWAAKVRDIRSYKLSENLRNYYITVGEDYAEVVDAIINNYPKDINMRQAQLSEELSKVNELLAKLDNEIAYEMYKSFKSFAKRVAKATGGFLGFGSISPDEQAWIDLPMLDEVHLDRT